MAPLAQKVGRRFERLGMGGPPLIVIENMSQNKFSHNASENQSDPFHSGHAAAADKHGAASSEVAHVEMSLG